MMTKYNRKYLKVCEILPAKMVVIWIGSNPLVVVTKENSK